MMHQNDQLQTHSYVEATKLAAAGEEFSHLIKLMNPEYALRLRIYVQQLPENIRMKTIYGRAVSRDLPKTTKRK
jgi:hypothetical protein